jgi:predicted alpha-1,6-mannanase (GH76 family)
VKLVKEFYDDRLWCVLAVERNGKAEYRQADCRAQCVTFRLKVDGDKISGSFLPVGGTEWRSLGEYAFERKDDARIGLTAHHAPADSDRKAAFKEFRILKPE